MQTHFLTSTAYLQQAFKLTNLDKKEWVICEIQAQRVVLSICGLLIILTLMILAIRYLPNKNLYLWIRFIAVSLESPCKKYLSQEDSLACADTFQLAEKLPVHPSCALALEFFNI